MATRSNEFPLEYAVRAWIRRHSGEWTDDDELRLKQWLEIGPENRAAYDKVAALWRTAGKLERPAAAQATVVERCWTGGRLAVAGVAVLTALLIFPAWRELDHWWNGVSVHWSTAQGEPKSLLLSDGTRALLDADSELITKFGAHSRIVSLVRGEASFTVTHDASRPFELEIGSGRVVDLGTRFDVERLQGVVHVAVFEGRVGIKTPRGELVLDAGRSSGYDNAGVLLAVRQADATAAIRPDGLRHFDNEPLAAVTARLERYHPVTFSFADPRLKALRVSGTFRCSDLPLAVRMLSAALPVKARWTGPQTVEWVASPPGDNSPGRNHTDTNE